MKVDIDNLTRYLHRIRNEEGWLHLNDVANSLKLDRATSRKFTKLAEDWGLVTRQQVEQTPTQVQATEKLMKLEPGEVRDFILANSSDF